MRKNPYIKDLKDRVPIFMYGPRTTTALTENEEQKLLIERCKGIVHLQKYSTSGVTFATVKPPVLNANLTFNPPDILDLEMGETEVTQELFEAVMGWNNSIFFDTTPQNPVENMTWFDCIDFCNKLSGLLDLKPCYTMGNVQRSGVSGSIFKAAVAWNEAANGFRLPTVSEWQSFAKAGTQNKWAACGSDVSEESLDEYMDEYMVTDYSSVGSTEPVKSKKANEWGLYDMCGNVWEWCWDIADFEDGDRITCGGSFQDNMYYCRIDYLGNTMMPDFIREEVGFRICRANK